MSVMQSKSAIFVAVTTSVIATSVILAAYYLLSYRRRKTEEADACAKQQLSMSSESTNAENQEETRNTTPEGELLREAPELSEHEKSHSEGANFDTKGYSPRAEAISVMDIEALQERSEEVTSNYEGGILETQNDAEDLTETLISAGKMLFDVISPEVNPPKNAFEPSKPGKPPSGNVLESKGKVCGIDAETLSTTSTESPEDDSAPAKESSYHEDNASEIKGQDSDAAMGISEEFRDEEQIIDDLKFVLCELNEQNNDAAKQIGLKTTSFTLVPVRDGVELSTYREAYYLYKEMIDSGRFDALTYIGLAASCYYLSRQVPWALTFKRNLIREGCLAAEKAKNFEPNSPEVSKWLCVLNVENLSFCFQEEKLRQIQRLEDIVRAAAASNADSTIVNHCCGRFRYEKAMFLNCDEKYKDDPEKQKEILALVDRGLSDLLKAQSLWYPSILGENIYFIALCYKFKGENKSYELSPLLYGIKAYDLMDQTYIKDALKLLAATALEHGAQAESPEKLKSHAEARYYSDLMPNLLQLIQKAEKIVSKASSVQMPLNRESPEVRPESSRESSEVEAEKRVSAQQDE